MVDKEVIAKVLAFNLKKIRMEKNLSMQDLALLAEIEKSQIVRMESGKVDVRLSSVYTVAIALKVDIASLLKPND